MSTLEYVKREISAKDTAKIVRKRLKAEYPGVKFSVRSKDGCIRISWTDGPAEGLRSDRDSLNARYQMYAGQGFDGMTDMRYATEPTLYANQDGTLEEVRYRTSFVFTQRTISQEWREEIAALMGEALGEPVDLTSYHDIGPDGEMVKRNGDGWDARYDLAVIDGEIVRCTGSPQYGGDIFRKYAQEHAR